MENGNKEILDSISTLSKSVSTLSESVSTLSEAVSTLSQHVDDKAEETKKELRGEISKLRGDLTEHITRTVNNATLSTRDPRVSKVVLKLRDKNVFDVQDVQGILSPPVAA